MPSKIDLAKFLADPEFQGDRELIFGVVDARLKHHAEEAAKNKPPAEKNFFDRLFGPADAK
jgi:hypothetical protein